MSRWECGEHFLHGGELGLRVFAELDVGLVILRGGIELVAGSVEQARSRMAVAWPRMVPRALPMSAVSRAAISVGRLQLRSAWAQQVVAGR